MSHEAKGIAADVKLKGSDKTRLSVLRAITEPIEDMTVSQISAAAGISRQTFYSLFQTKYDIAYWYITLVEKLYIYEIGRTLTLEEGLAGFFEMLDRERASLANALEKSPDKRELRARLAHLENELLWTIQSKGFEVTDDTKFCLAYTVESANCLVAGWCIHRAQESAATMTRRLLLCVPQKLAEYAAL